MKNVSRSCGGQNSAWRWDSVRSLSPPHDVLLLIWPAHEVICRLRCWDVHIDAQYVSVLCDICIMLPVLSLVLFCASCFIF